MILTSKILMVKPNNFRSNEETIVNNFFQKKSLGISNSVLNKIAIKEFNQFVRKLEDNEIEVVVIEGSRTLNNPDEIFPNNWIVFDQNKIGIFPMFAKNRRTEVNYDFIKKINSNNNYKIYDYTKYADSEIFLEGTGSFVLDRTNRIAYCSISNRSNEDLFIEFCEDFEFTPVIFKSFQSVGDKRLPIYHTNVMMCVATDYVIICLDSIDDKKQRKNVSNFIIESGKKLIEISEKQVESFAGNMLELINENGESILVMSKSAEDSLDENQRNTIANHSRIISCDINTIEVCGGGSTRCMMAEIFLPKK